MIDKEEAQCPNCKSCDVIPLLGVLPGSPPYGAEDTSRLPFGECKDVDETGDKQWHCNDCGHQWQQEKVEATAE